MLKLTIDTNSDAFSDGNGEAELARLLRRAADIVEGAGQVRADLYDFNGNLVGRMQFEYGNGDGTDPGDWPQQ